MSDTPLPVLAVRQIRWRKYCRSHRTLMVSLLMAGILLLCTGISLCAGNRWIGAEEVLSLLAQRDASDFEIWNHRVPRSLVAILTGSAFALAGTLTQGIIRNPLASPEILGVTQGAGLAVTAVIVGLPHVEADWMPWIACAGGMAGAGLLIFYNKNLPFSGVRFALSGIAIGVTLSTVTEFLVLVNPLDINTAMLAVTGSLWSRNWSHVMRAMPMAVLMAAAFLLVKPLNLMALGDEAAVSLGTTPGRVRMASLLIAITLTGLSVGLVGPVAFVGLIAPHMARRLVGADHRLMLPAAMLCGATLLVIADTLGRTLIAPTEVPAGIMTAVIGAPYFLWLLAKFKG